MWALGVIMFEIIAGYHPFYKPGMSRDQLIEILKNFKGFNYPKTMSNEAKHLIQRLCNVVSANRFRAKEALNHPWITREQDAPLPVTGFERV